MGMKHSNRVGMKGFYIQLFSLISYRKPSVIYCQEDEKKIKKSNKLSIRSHEESHFFHFGSLNYDNRSYTLF